MPMAAAAVVVMVGRVTVSRVSANVPLIRGNTTASLPSAAGDGFDQVAATIRSEEESPRKPRNVSQALPNDRRVM